MSLNEVLIKMQDPQTSPGELSAILMYLAAEYGKKSGEVGEILMHKADTWPKLRQDRESDKQADKAWDAMIEGRLETTLRLDLKMLEKLMGAIKAHLRVREVEARNQF